MLYSYSSCVAACGACRQIDLLDSKRSLNVNIFLRQFPASLSAADIVNVLLLGGTTQSVAADGRGCDAETLSCLLKLAPDDNEVDRLTTFSGDRRRLGAAERFLTQLISLPKYVRQRPRRSCRFLLLSLSAYVLYIHRVSKMCKVVFVRTSSNLHQL